MKEHVLKWKVKLISEASETVSWPDLTDPDPPNFTTDVCH